MKVHFSAPYDKSPRLLPITSLRCTNTSFLALLNHARLSPPSFSFPPDKRLHASTVISPLFLLFLVKLIILIIHSDAQPPPSYAKFHRQ